MLRPVCLDVTRLVSRVGAGSHTGIDRTEYAYLRELLDLEMRLYGLARTATGYVLLDRGGLRSLKARLDGAEPWGRYDVAAMLSRRLSPARRTAEADLRRLSIAHARKGGLLRIASGLPAGCLYLNTGHSNLAKPVFDAIRQVGDARAAVLVHDTIPVRRPDLQRPGTPSRFDKKLLAVANGADIVICTTGTERGHVEREICNRGGRPVFVTAPLGIEEFSPPSACLADTTRESSFVVVGTIEPRKNLRLLIDVWNALVADPPATGVPSLHIVGQRGWETPNVLARLDALKARTSRVHEHGFLDDGAKAALIARARALLFPTFDEGFGLPPLEALALGTPAVCSDLDVFRETMGDAPVYADPSDMYQWLGVVRDLAGDVGAMRAEILGRSQGLALPSWRSHVNRVLSMIP